MNLNLNRTQILAIATALLLVYAVAYHIWAGWGLITIHAKQEPLDKVIASMERQGHAKIESDLPTDTPVTMDVTRVPLTDALETLSVATESRWRLLYFVAGDKSTLQSAELAWFGGQRPDGWKLLAFPTGNFFSGDDDTTPPDPRKDVWTPKTAGPAPLQSFLSDAAALTNAGFAYPQDWNPTVNSAPKPGKVESAVPKLISAAGGREDQMFFLSKRGDRGPRTAGDASGPTIGNDLDLMAEHMQAQIDRLPPDQRADAQANYNAQRAFMESLKDMSDDERRAAFLAHLQDPQVQQQIANRLDAGENRMSHDQRMQRMQNYVNRKLSAMGKL